MTENLWPLNGEKTWRTSNFNNLLCDGMQVLMQSNRYQKIWPVLLHFSSLCDPEFWQTIPKKYLLSSPKIMISVLLHELWTKTLWDIISAPRSVTERWTDRETGRHGVSQPKIFIISVVRKRHRMSHDQYCLSEKNLNNTPIARFMGPIWGPPGADRTQVGPVLAPWT